MTRRRDLGSQRPVERTELANGVTVLTERVPGLRSISLGFWVLRGSRHEPLARQGAYHFLEHMLFKGTESRDTKAIARVVDSIGGQVNAFTGKESTCFYARILDEHVGTAIELLAELLMKPAFRPDDFERERKVILEELRMVEDTPDDLVQNLFVEGLWAGHPLARPILGTRDSVRSLTPEALAGFFRRNFRPGALLVAAAGNVEHDALVDRIGRELSALTGSAPAAAHTAPAVRDALVVRRRAGLNQAHVCIGAPAFARSDPRRHALSVLDVLLGTGMSSRLFQTVREERSLAYDVFSDTVSYRDGGYLVIYAGTRPGSVRALIDAIVGEIAGLEQRPVQPPELARAKEHLKGDLMLGLESSFSRMTHLAAQEIYLGRQESLDEMLSAIDGVTIEQVQEVVGLVFGGRSLSAAVLGKLPEGFKVDRSRLQL